MSGKSDFYMTPGEVQRSLKVSASGLRRLASAYEDVHGLLSKDAHGARIYPGAAVERLRAARSLLEAGRARSVKDGLNLLQKGVEPSPVPPEPLRSDSPALELVLARLESLQEEVRGLRAELQESRALPSDTLPQGGAQGATGGPGGAEGGLIVRAARRLERLLGGRQG